MDYDKVKASFGSWAELMKPFIESEEMDFIFGYLKDRSRLGKVICPHHTDTFRAFIECPFDELKCVMIAQDPYPWKDKDNTYVADGLALSCSHTERLQPSLELFYEGMEEDLCDSLSLTLSRNPDLQYLANQGVLLLNSSLTCELNKVASHSSIQIEGKEVILWKPFMYYLFNILNLECRAIPMVFMGKSAIAYSREVVPFHHWVLETEHPAAAAHKQRKWKHNNVFSKVNTILKQNYGEEIRWYQEHS